MFEIRRKYKFPVFNNELLGILNRAIGDGICLSEPNSRYKTMYYQ